MTALRELRPGKRVVIAGPGETYEGWTCEVYTAPSPCRTTRLMINVQGTLPSFPKYPEDLIRWGYTIEAKDKVSVVESVRDSMSTKIYNGMRINTGDIQKVMRILAELGASYDKVRARLAATRLATLAVRIVDLSWYDPETLKSQFPDADLQHPLQSARQVINKAVAQIKQLRMRDPLNDDEFTIVVIPQKRFTLLIPYTEQQAYRDIVTKHPKIKEYGYWDNVDWPDGMTRPRWERRRRDWDTGLGPRGVPGLAGLCREFECPTMPPDCAACLKHLPSMSERAREMAFDKAVAIEHAKLQKAKAPAVEMAGIEIDLAARAYRTVRNNMALVEPLVQDFVNRAPLINREVLLNGLHPNGK